MSYQSFGIIFSHIRRPILQIVDSQRDSEGVCKDMNVIVALMNNETDRKRWKAQMCVPGLGIYAEGSECV